MKKEFLESIGKVISIFPEPIANFLGKELLEKEPVRIRFGTMYSVSNGTELFKLFFDKTLAISFATEVGIKEDPRPKHCIFVTRGIENHEHCYVLDDHDDKYEILTKLTDQPKKTLREQALAKLSPEEQKAILG